MIAIQNEAGETLQLFSDQNLITEQATAWLTDDELPPEYSIPIDVPLNDHNKRFVRYGYRVDAAQPRAVMPVMVHLNNVFFRRCQLAYKVQNGRLNAYLKIDSAEVYDKIKKLSLLEALPDRIPMGTGVLQAVNGKRKILADRMDEIAALPPGEFPFTFFPIRNEGFWEDGLEDKLPGFSRQRYVNVWELHPTGGFGFRQDGGFLPNEKGYAVVPQFYLSWVLEKIMALAGYQIKSSWLAEEDTQQLTVTNMTAIDSSIGTILSDPAGVLMGHTVRAGMHLPDMSVSEFLRAIKGRFGLIFGFNANTRTCYIERFEAVKAAGAAVDLTQFQTGSYDSGELNGEGFTVSEFIDSDDALYKDQKGDLVPAVSQSTGRGRQTISLRCGTCQMANEVSLLMPTGENLPTSNWIVPTVKQPGNTLDNTYQVSERYLDERGKRRNNIGLKLLYYRGMTQDSRGNPYPLGTNDNRDGRQVVVGKSALTLTGRYGSWRQYLRAYYYFRDNTQPVSVKLLLPVSRLVELSMLRSVFLSLDDQIRRSYVIAKIQAETPGIDGKAVVQLQVLTLPSGVEESAEVDEPIVWVEWIVGEIDYHDKPLLGLDHEFTRSYTVKIWADRSKTAPAVANNLQINVRQKHRTVYNKGSAGEPATRYVASESVLSYQVSGQTAVVESAYIVDAIYPIYNLDGNTSDGYYQDLYLDPGDDYNILS